MAFPGPLFARCWITMSKGTILMTKFCRVRSSARPPRSSSGAIPTPRSWIGDPDCLVDGTMIDDATEKA